ncbi:unnamed protein product [Triticum turgidum subsp. durum]|uniref:NADP-dependent oxidoreductase domain-containing protein n=1 Tax=Triticum turgidum subsp. durum TaxID=4567 RepID=A0A9R1Q5W4_TRITD|nr:unnamed protein product [Triticum turgidum subsp. durum]
MPAVGLGVWRMDAPAIRGLIHSAIRAGYRHFDCAAKYQNEAEVGDALAEAFEIGLIKREDLFITTKLWNSDHGHVVEACKDSLKKLQLDYLDLYLIHFPVATKHTGIGKTASALGDDGVLDINTTISLETTWHGMEDLVSMGLVRSIGISNYNILLTRDCLAYAKIKPSLAEKYGKTPAQLVLRWGLQRNTVVIPKTSKAERLQENLAVVDFDISSEDMEKIKALDRNYRTNQPAKFWGIDIYA